MSRWNVCYQSEGERYSLAGSFTKREAAAKVRALRARGFVAGMRQTIPAGYELTRDELATVAGTDER